MMYAYDYKGKHIIPDNRFGGAFEVLYVLANGSSHQIEHRLNSSW